MPLAEADTRQFVLESDQRFILGCPGTAFSDSSVMKEGRCVAGTLEVEGEDMEELGDLECDRQPVYTTEVVGNAHQIVQYLTPILFLLQAPAARITRPR